MKFIQVMMTSFFISLLLSSISYAACCGEDSNCGGQGLFACGGGPGRTCDCTDPACRETNPCLSPSRCCQAFGNIGSIDGFPND